MTVRENWPATEMRSHYAAQVGLELPGSSDPPEQLDYTIHLFSLLTFT